MILYIVIITISASLIVLLNALLQSVCFVDLGLWNLILLVAGGVAIEFILDLIISAIVLVLPAKTFKCFGKVYKWEKKFYDKLHIKKWKDRIPVGKGPIGVGINKKNLDNTGDIAFLRRFIDECFKAEVMHFISMFVGFALILIYPLKYALVVSLPIILVNMFLQALPFMVQRYNLPKLEILLKRNLALEARKVEQTEHQKQAEA